ncbi:MAG: hypothetical protein ABJE95_00185 [Byssovorax sp.]
MKGIATLVGAAILGAIAAGCDEQTSVTTVAGPPATASASEPRPPPRRPTRRYLFARTGNRCEVYSVDGEQVSASESFPCVADLNPGESIRIAGKTCTRESPDADRREPVVCPDPLTNREKRDIAREHPPAPPGSAK